MSSKLGESRRSIFTGFTISLPHYFPVWGSFEVVVRSLPRVRPARGNSLQLRINHTDTPRHLVEREGAGIYTMRAELLLHSESTMYPF